MFSMIEERKMGSKPNVRKLDSKTFAIDVGNKTFYVKDSNGSWKGREAYTNREINLGSSKLPLKLDILTGKKK